MKSKNENGFTLIEVIVSLLILAIGILGVAGIQIASVKGTTFSSNLTQAAVLAQDSLESLKSLSLNDALLTTGNHAQQTVGIFQRTYNVTYPGNYARIQYIVSWKENQNDHSVSFITIKAR